MSSYGYKLYTDRELLERIAYMGPSQSQGGGVVRTYDWSGAVSEGVVWTPQSGNRFIISNIVINASAKCTVTLYDQVDGELSRIFKGSVAADSSVVIPYPIPRISDHADNELRITTSAIGGYVTIFGWETGIGAGYTTTTISSSISSSSISSSSSSVSSSSSSSSSSSISSSSSSLSSSSISSSSSSSISTTTTIV